MKRKSAFTLLEMLIAMAILSLVGTVVGFQIHGMVASHRFRSGGDRFCIALQEAQLLAIAHQTDINVRLFKEKNTWWYQIHTLEPLPILDQSPKELYGVDTVTGGNHLAIYATGRIEPPQVIGLQRGRKETFWIDLQTPFQIKLAFKKPEPFKQQLPTLPKERKAG